MNWHLTTKKMAKYASHQSDDNHAENAQQREREREREKEGEREVSIAIAVHRRRERERKTIRNDEQGKYS